MHLFARLKDKDCVVMAHVGGRYADIKYAHDARETPVEVHSAWGTFEWILRDAFENSYRVGIVANSDGHKGRPGACYPGRFVLRQPWAASPAFWRERLDRSAIFESMRRRRHYATTGNRAFLSVSVRPQPMPRSSNAIQPPDRHVRAWRAACMMGDIARVTDNEVELAVEVIGSAPIERLGHLRWSRPPGDHQTLWRSRARRARPPPL